MAERRLVVCEDELSGHPVMERIRDAVSDVESFDFERHLPLFQYILASDLAVQATKLALRKVAANNQYQLGHFVMEGLVKGWTILATEHFRVSVGCRNSEWGGAKNLQAPIDMPPQAAISVKMEPYPFDLFLGVLRVGQLEIEQFKVIEPDCHSGDHSLLYHSKKCLHAGSSLFLKAGEDVTFSRLSGTLIYLEITGNPKVRLLPCFDPIDHSFCGWISGDPTSSRIEILTRMLADFNYQPGIEVIEQLTHHQDHHVRWNSMRHLLRLNHEAGLERVRDAAALDASRDLREVAAEVLASLDAEVQEN